ncbi:hypothetical protein GQ457_13G007290 [Hibiscus cannabinus]
MSVSGIPGHILEVTVVGCNKLKDTEWIQSKTLPYVVLNMAAPSTVRELALVKFSICLFLSRAQEIDVVVWNSNTLTFDDFIGSGKVQLNNVRSQGFDDAPCHSRLKPAGKQSKSMALACSRIRYFNE